MAETNPWVMTALCYTADDMRRLVEGQVCVEGVSGVESGALLVTTGGTGLTVSVAQGGAFIEGDSGDDQGTYWVYSDAPVTLTLTTAHATLPRIDTVIAHVYDAQYAGISNDWALEVVAGTPTLGATLLNLTGAGAVPGDAIALTHVLVPAAFTGPFVDATHLLDARESFQSCGMVVENESYVHLRRVAAWSTATGNPTFRFDTVLEGSTTAYDAVSSGIYTCPEDGLYFIEVSLGANASGANQTLMPVIYHNGVAIAEGVCPGPNSSLVATGAEATTMKRCAKGDTILFTQQAATAGLTGLVDTRTRAAIYRI